MAFTVSATKAVTVSVCAIVDDKVVVNPPALLVLPLGDAKVLLEPLADMATGCPATGLPCASSAVTITVATLLPSAATVLGLTTNVVVVPLTAPAINVTLVVAVAAPATPVMVFASALVDVRVAPKVPVLSVVPDGGVNVLLDPLLDNVTFWLATGLPKASLTTKVSCVVLVPLAVTDAGLADSVELALEGAPAVKVTVVVLFKAPTVPVMVFTSAVLEASVVV